MSRHVDLAVVGGGITGLAAAWEARKLGADVVVLDGADRVGGKLGTSDLAGHPVEESADAFLTRVPDAVELCRELGLGDELVAPRTGRAFVWVDGALRPLPPDQLLGVPTNLDAVADSGILSPEGLARARSDLVSPDDVLADLPTDESVGALVRRRLGDEVLDRLVAPLVGGIWAGDCDRLSVAVATPALTEARRRDPSLMRGAAAVRADTGTGQSDGNGARNGVGATTSFRGPAGEDVGKGAPAGMPPVFLAPRGGMARLVEVLSAALGDDLRLGQPVSHLERLRGGWRIEPAGISAAAVVLATPSFAAADLLQPHCPPAADTLAGIDHASIALVTLAVPRDGIDHPLDGSGFLVPPTEGRMLTTCSWLSSKWEHLEGDGSVALLRASAGRDGDERALKCSDESLVRHLCDDLQQTMGLQADPVAWRVNRWPRSFPQPRPGHLARVARLEAELAQAVPGLAVAGNWARGLGIPACIRSGRQAARDLLARSATPASARDHLGR